MAKVGEISLKMFVFPCLLFLMTATDSSFAVSQDPYDVKYYDQTVDHFSFYRKIYGKETYKERYLVQDKWWAKGKGPIFFYAGNEGPITTFWNNTGFVFDIAPQFQALVVFAEHRFYGDSLPFGADQSFKHPYVDLLTVEQALADYAVLLTDLKKDLAAEDCPVIAFGGSYGGMLSAYMRFKYPNIIDGSIAASAPIYLVGGATTRDFFFQDVTKDFHDAVPGCDNKVRQAFQEINTLASKGKTGYQEISKSFNLCKTITDTKGLKHLQGWVRNSFTMLAMMDYPYPTQFMATLPGFPVKVACQKLLGATDVLTGLAQAASLMYGGETGKCHDIWSEFVECADPTGCGLGPDSLAWDYQACTEMTMPSGTNNVTDMFPVLPFTLDQQKEYCEKVWQVTPSTKWVGISLWGKDIEGASNIVFSNGDLDPWHRGGVLKNVSSSVIAAIVKGGAHHLDLRHSNPVDPESVKTVRKLEVAQIRKWIKQANRKTKKVNRTRKGPDEVKKTLKWSKNIWTE